MSIKIEDIEKEFGLIKEKVRNKNQVMTKFELCNRLDEALERLKNSKKEHRAFFKKETSERKDEKGRLNKFRCCGDFGTNSGLPSKKEHP